MQYMCSIPGTLLCKGPPNRMQQGGWAQRTTRECWVHISVCARQSCCCCCLSMSGVCVQASLEAERLALQARLKDALQLHMAPRTQLDTSSPIDRTVTLLDGLLEVHTSWATPPACYHSWVKS